MGGIILFFTDKIEAIVSITPAAPSKWPVIDLVELILISNALSPNNLIIAVASEISPSGVDVP